MKPICFVCEKQVTTPTGYSRSNILIIGEKPENVMMKETSSKVLRQEMAEVGLDLYQCRMAYLWYHEPNKNDDCFKASLDVVLNEAKGKQAILLLGADVVEHFTEYKVSDVSGLQVDSNMLSAPIIYASVQPSIVYHSRGVGEVKLSINRFVTELREEGII